MLGQIVGYRIRNSQVMFGISGPGFRAQDFEIRDGGRGRRGTLQTLISGFGRRVQGSGFRGLGVRSRAQGYRTMHMKNYFAEM